MTFKNKIALYLIFSFLSHPGVARAAESIIEKPSFWSIFTNLPEDYDIWAKRVFAKDNIPTLLAITGSTVFLIAYDLEFWELANNNYNDRNPAYKEWSDIGVFVGDGIFQFSVAGLFLLDGVIEDSPRAYRTSAQIVESILATG